MAPPPDPLQGGKAADLSKGDSAVVSVPYVPEADRPSAPRPPHRAAFRRYVTATLLILSGLTGAIVLLHAVG